MAVEIKKLENSSVELVLTLEGAEVKEAKAEVVKKIAGEVELPGFRKGKAPLSTIEAKFEGNIKEEVTDKLLKNHYETIVKENDLRPVDYLRTVSVELTDEKFVGSFVVDVYPEVKLGEYKGLEVEKEAFEMSDEILNNELEGLVEKGAKLVEAEEGYAAQLDDTVSLDFEGFVDGEAFEGGKAEGYTLKLGSKSFIDTFEDQLVGYVVGQEGEVNVTFPEEYFKDELAGKPALFKVKVNGIKKLEKPALDDEFAKDNGFDTLDELKTKKREEIVAREEARIESEYRNAIINKAIENAEITVPASMTNREIRTRIGEIENNLKMQGASLDMYLQMSGLTVETLAGQLRPMAEAKVKRDVVLGTISETEAVNVSDEELEAKVADVAKAYNMEVEKLREELTKAGNLNNFMENLKVDVEINKTVDILVANAK
jgi:trigger factor